jgi:hypothetical protein
MLFEEYHVIFYRSALGLPIGFIKKAKASTMLEKRVIESSFLKNTGFLAVVI